MNKVIYNDKYFKSVFLKPIGTRKNPKYITKIVKIIKQGIIIGATSRAMAQQS